jgi:hypothetical protein
MLLVGNLPRIPLDRVEGATMNGLSFAGLIATTVASLVTFKPTMNLNVTAGREPWAANGHGEAGLQRTVNHSLAIR